MDRVPSPLKVTLLTSRTAKDLVESYVKMITPIEGLEVDIVELPVHAISMLPTEVIARIIAKNDLLRRRLGDSDVILVPGNVRGDASVISKIAGKPVYKASKALSLLPQVLRHIASGGVLDTIVNAENIIPLERPRVDYIEAFRLNGVSIPLRGPPLVISAEIPYWIKGDDFKRVMSRYVGEGAQIIVVGSSFEVSPEDLGVKVSTALELGCPVLAEAPTRDHARVALDSGASGLVVSAESVEHIAGSTGGDVALVVGDRNLGVLEEAVNKAREVGLTKIIVDPVVGIPLVDFSQTVERYKIASKLGLPMLFSSANVTEEVEADSHGVHALLAILAVELGASVYHVVEDSYKTVHSVSEAREALRLATEAYVRRESMRGYYSRLLVVKQANPPEKATSKPGERINYIEPRWDKRGYVKIEVDHDRGVIVVSYIGYDGNVVSVEGTHGPSLVRALTRKIGLDAEHAAYVGYEVAKAEIALKLGKTYIQDEEVIIVPWGTSSG